MLPAKADKSSQSKRLDIPADEKYTVLMEDWIWRRWVDRNQIIRSCTGFLCAEYEDILNYSELHEQSVTKTFLDGYALLRKETSQEDKN